MATKTDETMVAINILARAIRNDVKMLNDHLAEWDVLVQNIGRERVLNGGDRFATSKNAKPGMTCYVWDGDDCIVGEILMVLRDRIIADFPGDPEWSGEYADKLARKNGIMLNDPTVSH